MKKHGLGEKIRYTFGRLLSRHAFAMILLLFSFMLLAVLLIGTVAFFVSDDGGWLLQIWSSLMHTLDTGALAGDPTGNIPYLVMMSLATLCGLLVTSVLIGIITTGFEEKLASLKKGLSVVQVEGHTTIIGFNQDVYSLLSELIEANKSKKKAYIVVLGEQPIEEMQDAIAAHIPKTYTTQIICRSGLLHAAHSLELCSVESSQSVIVNTTDDVEALKILLALSIYTKKHRLYNPDLHYIVSLQSDEYLEAAALAGEGRTKIVYARDAIARIIVNTCRQHGLSKVLTELFDFDGDEMYVERIPQLAGKTFGETMLCFKNATLIGLISNGIGRLNPPMDTVITAEDGLVLLEEDDGVFDVCAPLATDDAVIEVVQQADVAHGGGLVILGSNDKLPIILEEYDRFMPKHTKALVVDEDLDDALIGSYQNLDVEVQRIRINKEVLYGIIEQGADNILLLNDDSHDTQQSDANTLVVLMLLRDIAEKTGKKFAITTEMHHAENRKLAAPVRVDDFVIGSNFACLLMAQISECPELSPLIDDFLDEDGSELYIKPAVNYIKLGVPVSMATLTKSASLKGEVFLGYRVLRDGRAKLDINPDKDIVIVFEEGDQVIVVAED